MFRRWLRMLWRGRWVVRQCGFPYKPGYATYHPRTHTILDTGLSYEQAVAEARLLNEEERK